MNYLQGLVFLLDRFDLSRGRGGGAAPAVSVAIHRAILSDGSASVTGPARMPLRRQRQDVHVHSGR